MRETEKKDTSELNVTLIPVPQISKPILGKFLYINKKPIFESKYLPVFGKYLPLRSLHLVLYKYLPREANICVFSITLLDDQMFRINVKMQVFPSYKP